MPFKHYPSIAMQSKQLLLGLICFSFALPLYTEEAANLPSEEEEECSLQNPSSFRISAAQREGRGIGYNEGYSSIDGFFTFSNIRNFHPFFDARAHIFNNGKLAANAGFGVRYQPQSLRAIFGVNGFFDFRRTYSSTFEQVGVGLEALGAKWEGRINGYFPIICRNNLYGTSFTGFSGHNALFSVKRELAFKGVDASLGRTLLQKQYYSLGATLGGYMFFADYNNSAKGGLFKLKAAISQYFSIEGQASYDNLFKGIVQGQVAFNIPFGGKVKARTKGISCPDRLSLASRIVESVDRFEIIVTNKHKTQTVGKNPRTHEDLVIVFVDNMTASGGDGTAETPYNTLLAAQNNSTPNEMIYVYAGTGTPLGMNAGIALQDSQWLQGSGLPFLVFTTFGLSEIPAQTTNWPTISSTTGNTVTLANSNIVQGFNIISKGHGISGSNVSDIQCISNKLSGSSDFDIYLSNVAGNIKIDSNTSLSQNGLSLATNNDALVNIKGNVFRNAVPQTSTPPTPGSKNLKLLFQGNSNSTAIIEFNDLSLCQDGSTITARDNSRLSLSFEGNDIHDIQASAPYALSFSAISNSLLIAVVKDNLFESPTDQGLNFTTSVTANSLLYVLNNTGTYSASESGTPFYFSVDTTATSTLSLENNVANSDGYLLSNSNTSTFNVGSSDLSITGVQNINSGTIQTSGIITFISPPSSVPEIE
ncbi:MAG: inverse autotransporter beta domain-containing protein [Rhabdochlamydiaceae bacterium]|nr:inverse autotransporter beta domain-containing protein [Rhabdochlamydiaceae bacterium]